MTNKEKIKKIQAVIDHSGRERTYYSLLEDLGDLKGNYADYMTTKPLNCMRNYSVWQMQIMNYVLHCLLRF